MRLGHILAIEPQGRHPSVAYTKTVPLLLVPTQFFGLFLLVIKGIEMLKTAADDVSTLCYLADHMGAVQEKLDE